MKKKNTFLSIALLLAVVVLGVGYAASSGPWVIEGTATAKASDLDVKFTTATGDGNPTVVSEKLGEMTVELTEIGETATATFTIKNNSKTGIAADINPDTITVTYADDATSSDYFNVTHSLAKTALASGEETTLTVTVELKKVGLTNVTETFKVSINEITARAE